MRGKCRGERGIRQGNPEGVHCLEVWRCAAGDGNGRVCGVRSHGAWNVRPNPEGSGKALKGSE